ncbi:DUF2721 domain-containing protein [Arundinibacter roseus]|uniref:DUF2721 domain-containing protein n=1 Tax=Arundinibacter roseus TaxID=2070510 RepID=A0A4R4KEP9_9BACT|nr:DUF2721 domain-containing protein [Arundinibacter roseus]TDB65276.1 DUF2721 domain-containing protein [Arundinibacter roseus]
MELTLSTPALLFSTVSLLMIAFTNRFLAIANLIRDLHKQFQINPEGIVVAQIKNLHMRLRLIRTIQALAVLSLLLSAICMLVLLYEQTVSARILFIGALVLQITALGLSVIEISVSIKALQFELNDMEEALGKRRFDIFNILSKPEPIPDKKESNPSAND